VFKSEEKQASAAKNQRIASLLLGGTLSPTSLIISADRRSNGRGGRGAEAEKVSPIIPRSRVAKKRSGTLKAQRSFPVMI